MADTSQWFEELSSDADSRRARRHLDRLIASIIQRAAVRQGNDDVLRIIRAGSDSQTPDEPANSP
jgi:hypothetical protein